MKTVAHALRGFFVVPVRAQEKRPLSRQDVLRLMAANKLSPAQARAILDKRI